MLTGENGILTKANEARTKTEKANMYEQRKLASLEATMNTQTYEYKDKNNKIAPIPAGYATTGIEGEDIIDNGLVITDSDENEFVWIPVSDIDSYKKNETYNQTNISQNATNDINYLPDGINNEKDAVLKENMLRNDSRNL